MKNRLRSIILGILCLVSYSASAQNETAQNQWKPTANWPFVYEEFVEATVYTTQMKTIKTKANIHMGTLALWFENRGQRLESVPGQINHVIFKNNDTYYAFNDKMLLVVREDTINGEIARLYIARQVNQEEYERMMKRNMSTLSLTGDSPLSASGFAARLADSESSNPSDLQPLPVVETYYMLYNNKTFEASESKIEKLLSKEERKVYYKYLRNNEDLKDGRRPMENIWIRFILKQNQ